MYNPNVLLANPLTLTVSCNEDDPQIDPSNYFNLAAPNTQVIKTPGGRVENSIDTINDTDQSTRIGMIVVLHHTS